VQFALSVNKIDTDELQHLTATSPSRPDGNGSLLNTVTGSGKLTVGSIKAQDILLGNVSAAIQLNHGQITLSPLSAGAFGGSVSGAITADMRPATPLCSAKTKLAGIDANALLSAVSSMKNQLYGSLSGTTDLSFALASSADLPRTLNGTLAFSLAKGEIKNVNIMGELAKAGKLLGNTSLANAGSSTALKELDGTLTFANGLATTNNLRAALDSGSLTASGSVNLVNQDLNMHVTATLAGQTAGGGILGAVLANNKGELVVPVIVTGNTAHMTFTPDVEAMAKQRLGGILGQKQNPDAKQQNPINSILNQFLKKKL
jgi:AsmA protein